MIPNNTLKSTRFQSAIVLFIAACIFLGLHIMTADQWVSFIEWIFGTYALSEVGSKGATAYKDKISG